MSSDPNLDRANFKTFLEEFSSTHAGTDNLPFSSLTCHMTKDEIEGECLEWVTNCLVGQNKAPYVLAAAIARATVDIVLGKDLTTFVANDEGRYGDDKDETCTLYDAGHIFPLVWSTVNDLCERWKTDLPDLKLPPKLHQVSHCSVKNTRKRMEDKHVIVPDLNALFSLENDKERSFYAVYDGHGGTDAAMYACQHLHGNAIRQDCFLTDPTQALTKSFQITDEGFLKKARREGLGSGSTGVAVVIESDKLHISWLGDSQAYLMRDGRPVTLMEPHKPERPDEKQRIEQLGGCVLFFGVWRVNGTLAVSRAIGDPDQKPYISSEADCTTVPLSGTEDCVIIACDGLWDVVEPSSVCRIIQQSINGDSERDSVAHRLVAEAKSSGSSDNITILVVFLNPTQREIQEESAVDGGVNEEEAENRKGEDEEKNSDEPASNVDEEPQPECEDDINTDPSEPTDSETNSNNNNRTMQSNVGRKTSVGARTSTDRDRAEKKLETRQRSVSDCMVYTSSNSAERITPGNTKNETSRKPGSVNQHKSFQTTSSSSKRLGKNTCRIRKSSSVESTAKNKSADRDLIKPTSDLEISPYRQTQKSDVIKSTGPSAPNKSMPVTVKPKSMQRTKSSPRQTELNVMLKNKPKHASKSNFSNLELKT